MKKNITKFLSSICLLLSVTCLFGQSNVSLKSLKDNYEVTQLSSYSLGAAPYSTSIKDRITSPEILRGENSQAIVSIGEAYELNHFTLNNPSEQTPYGTYGSEFLNSAEYFGGMFYYATYFGSYGTINPVTGEIIPISTGNPYGSIAYNPSDNQLYGISLGTNPTLFVVDAGSGSSTAIITCETDHYIFGMTITNDGIYLVIDGGVNGISELDPQTGTLSPIVGGAFTVNYGQDITCDRETNIPYWAAYNADEFKSSLYSINLANYTGTLIGDFPDQASCFAIMTEPNTSLANPPTNFTLTPDANHGLSADLSWTNPTTNVAGTPLENIDQIVIKRDGEIVKTYSNPSLGAQMTYTDFVDISATYTYSVYAVTSEGDGIPAIASDVIGILCPITVYGHDSYGDGWTGNFIGFQDPFGNSFGFFTVYGKETTDYFDLPKGSIIQCVWYPGGYSDEVDSIRIVGEDGDVIYSSSEAPNKGVFYAFSNRCSEIVPNPPTNFVANANPDNSTSAVLSWTNPSTDINGNTLSSLNKIVIIREDIIVKEIENPTIGSTMTYTDELPESGAYTYMIYAVDDAGCSNPVSCTMSVGDLCLITINMFDSFGDGWGTAMITVLQNNQTIGTATLASGSSGTAVIPVPMGLTDFKWTSGVWDDEISFVIYDASGIPIYSCDNAYGMQNGSIFFSFNNNCTETETMEISGTVSQLSDNTPIAGASLFFDGLLGETVTTDDNGHYSIELIQGYLFDIIVNADGYNTFTEWGYTIPSQPDTKNFSLTAPNISVSPSSVTMSAPQSENGSATVTVSNNGNGPLTCYFTPEYPEKHDIQGISYDDYLQMSGKLSSKKAPFNSGKAPKATPAYMYNPLPTKFGTSNALITFNTEFNSFTLENPLMTEYLGDAPEMVISAEYIDGIFYFSTNINTILGTVDFQTGNTKRISIGNLYNCIAYNPVNQQLYGLSINSPAIIYTVDIETGSATPLVACQSGFILGLAINNEGRFFVINASIGGICEVDPTTGAFINTWPCGFSVNYAQDIACDRTTNEIYWASYNADANAAQLYHVNTNNGNYTLIGTFSEQATGLAIEGAIGWLQADPAITTIQPGEFEFVTLTGHGIFEESNSYHATAHFRTKNPVVGSSDVNVTFIVGNSNCEPPTELEAVSNKTDAICLNWTAPSNKSSDDAIFYNIYRDGNKIASNVEGESYNDSDVSGFTRHCYTVTHVCTIGESIESNEDCEALIDGIDDKNIDYQIYPNPTDNSLTIVGKNIGSIAIYNVIGQQIDIIEVNNNEITTINTSSYKSGVYVMQIASSDGVITTQRIVVAH